MIDNIKRSKVYYIPDINKRDSLLVGYFYVKDKVVYYRQDVNDKPSGSSGHLDICDAYFGKDYPLYDFSLNEGDTASVYCGDVKLIVTLVDTLILEGIKQKRIFFNGYNNGLSYWLEGMGSTMGLFDHVEKIPTCSCYSRQFVCFCHNDTVLYLHPAFSECPQADFSSINEIKQDMVNISYNPTEHTISITSPYLINQVKIVNSSGVLLQKEQINGKYQTIVRAEHLPETGVCVAQIIFQDGRTVSKKIISK